MNYPYIVLEVPHQRPPCAWVAWDESTVWNIVDQRGALPCGSDGWSAEEVLDYYGEDLHALCRFTEESARAALETPRHPGVPTHNRPAALAALRKALADLEV